MCRSIKTPEARLYQCLDSPVNIVALVLRNEENGADFLRQGSVKVE